MQSTLVHATRSGDVAYRMTAGSLPTGLPSGLPSDAGGAGGAGALLDPEVQQALKACGLELPGVPGAS